MVSGLAQDLRTWLIGGHANRSHRIDAMPGWMEPCGVCGLTDSRPDWRLRLPPRPAPEMAVDRSSGAPRARTLMIGSTPTGSPVWLDDEAAPLCTTPCQLTIAGARHTLRVSRSGYVSEQLTVNAKTPNDWAPELQRQRGQIVVDSPEPGARLLLNGKLAAFSLPTRLSLAVGVYLVGTKTPTTEASTFITIVPDRTLRLTVGR